MTTAEAHAIAVAVQERRAELARYRDWYATNTVGREWTDLARENAIRLDELDRLLLFANVAEMSEGEARAMAGNR